MMQIFVRTPSGKLIDLEVGRSSTIKHVKALIQKQRIVNLTVRLRDGTSFIVKTIAGNTVTLQADTINGVQATTEGGGTYDIPPDPLDLLFSGEKLEDDKTLADYNIMNESILYFRRTMHIIIKTLKGRTLSLEVGSCDTIGDLKDTISVIEDIPTSKLTLIYSGRQLEDEKTLVDYHITNGSTISVFPALKGC